jgi:hypothetical protein
MSVNVKDVLDVNRGCVNKKTIVAVVVIVVVASVLSFSTGNR